MKNLVKTGISNTFLTQFNPNSLTNITIPNSVTYIEDYAFYYYYNLTDVYYTGNENDWGRIIIGDDNECLTNETINYNYVIPVQGDINDDGEVTLDDAIYALRSIVFDIGLTVEQLARVDLNNDGNLTVVDVLMLQSIILEISENA